MRNAVLATAALLAATATAAAQPALTDPAQPREVPQVKSETTATALAIGATLGGLALVRAGAEGNNGDVVMSGVVLTLIGPSVGHFYAGETGHGLKMSLLRTGGALVLGMGLIASLNTEEGAACDGCGGGGAHHDSHTAERMVWVGGATVVAATLYDLWDAHNAARRTNEKAARSWTMAPSLMTSASGTTAPALAISGSW